HSCECGYGRISGSLQIIGGPGSRRSVEVSNEPVGRGGAANALDVDDVKLRSTGILRDVDIIAVADVHAETKEGDVCIAAARFNVLVSAGQEKENAGDHHRG